MRHITHGNLWITRGGMHPTGTVTNFDWFLCASLSYFHRSDWDQKKNVPYPSAHSFHLQCGAMSTTFGDLSCSSRPILMKWTSQHSDELIVETFRAPQIFWMFIRLENPEAHKNTKSALRTVKRAALLPSLRQNHLDLHTISYYCHYEADILLHSVVHVLLLCLFFLLLLPIVLAVEHKTQIPLA